MIIAIKWGAGTGSHRIVSHDASGYTHTVQSAFVPVSRYDSFNSNDERGHRADSHSENVRVDCPVVEWESLDVLPGYKLDTSKKIWGVIRTKDGTGDDVRVANVNGREYKLVVVDGEPYQIAQPIGDIKPGLVRRWQYNSDGFNKLIRID